MCDFGQHLVKTLALSGLSFLICVTTQSNVGARKFRADTKKLAKLSACMFMFFNSVCKVRKERAQMRKKLYEIVVCKVSLP